MHWLLPFCVLCFNYKISPHFRSLFRQGDLKSLNAIISMFSSDLLNLYTQLLYKISHDHEQPHLHTATFIGQRGATIISILQPVISSLHVLLEAVIRCRDTEYQDLTIVPALLRTHTLLSVVPNSSSYYQQARDTTASLVTCLLTFTSPNVDLTKNKVSKSLWTMMVAEVLNYIVSSPAVLKSGLELLSQLLPLPLPIPSNRELTEEEVTNVSTSRKLWSAHLHPLSSQISKLLGVASSYSHPPLVSLLQKQKDQPNYYREHIRDRWKWGMQLFRWRGRERWLFRRRKCNKP